MPRNGVSTAVHVGPNAKQRLNKLVFWPMVQSHDVMKNFKDAKFQDHPTISSEYVKFLVANSGGNGDLNTKYLALKDELTTAVKSAKALELLVSKALNAIDEHKKKIANLERLLAIKDKK